MGIFNNFGEYDAKEEAARRAENLRLLEESDIPAKPFVEADFTEIEQQILAKRFLDL